jgi:hypothetical protein
MRSSYRHSIIGAVAIGAIVVSTSRAQLYVPDRLFIAPRTDYDSMPNSTLSINGISGFATIPVPPSLVVEETNLVGGFPPEGTPGGRFERNEHVMRFTTAAEAVAGNPNRFGHLYQRSEAWDIAFDMKIEVPNGNVAPRKEAGLYFKSPLGNALFLATSNNSHYTTGPGEITTIYGDVIPGFSFSSPPGPLGDYNHNGTVDAADYVIWRKTLGVRDDGMDPAENMAANGNNEGASENFIDEADYQTWRMNYGLKSVIDPTKYIVGQTIRLRLIYMPPEENPSIAFDPQNPGANVTTPGTLEYQISLDGGPVITSEPVDFDNAWKGIPNNTTIMLRVQNLSTAAAAPDASKVTFSNFDFNGPAAGLGSGLAASVPEPGSLILAAWGALAFVVGSRRRRVVNCVE